MLWLWQPTYKSVFVLRNRNHPVVGAIPEGLGPGAFSSDLMAVVARVEWWYGTGMSTIFEAVDGAVKPTPL